MLGQCSLCELNLHKENYIKLCYVFLRKLIGLRSCFKHFIVPTCVWMRGMGEEMIIFQSNRKNIAEMMVMVSHEFQSI